MIHNPSSKPSQAIHPGHLKPFAILFDLSVVTLLCVIALILCNLSPLPRLTVFSLLLGVTFTYFFVQKKIFHHTWGGKLWGQNHSNQNIGFITIFTGGLFTTLGLLIAAGLVNELILKHPYWLQASIWQMEPLVPNPKSTMIAPFFYALGGWPKTFQNQPIFYTIPYEKGPPTRFVGRIVAELESPDIRLVIEGPKTPDPIEKLSTIKNCIVTSPSLQCLNLRETILSRHLKEIRSFSPKNWTLKWFHIENPMLPPESQPQGIYLRASGLNGIQDRFILITNTGVHQSIILNRPRNESGNKAFLLAQEIVRSLRIFDELNSGRAWINRSLEGVHLDDIQNIKEQSILLSSLVNTQGLLISKISVDPTSYDSFFHLAGTSMMISKAATHTRDKLYVTSLKNIQSMSQFAADLAPYDSRTVQIQNMLNDIKKR